MQHDKMHGSHMQYKSYSHDFEFVSHVKRALQACGHAVVARYKSLTNVIILFRFMQSNVLPNENTYADATQVEPIQKLVDLWQL